MNLGITPINFKNNYQNNNSQQNFGALRAKLCLAPKETSDKFINSLIVRNRDSIIDRFLGAFEKYAKEIKLDTEALDRKGYIAHFIPEAEYSKTMNVFLKDKKGNIVQHNEIPVFIPQVKRGNEFDRGELFADEIKDLNLDKMSDVK